MKLNADVTSNLPFMSPLSMATSCETADVIPTAPHRRLGVSHEIACPANGEMDQKPSVSAAGQILAQDPLAMWVGAPAGRVGGTGRAGVAYRMTPRRTA